MKFATIPGGPESQTAGARLRVWLAGALVATTMAAGCSRPDHADQANPSGAAVTRDQFQLLRSLQGTWRGTQPDGSRFYESYVFTDDSTIQSFGYPDSTFAQAADSSTIALRDGHVTTKGGASVWLATRLDSTIVRFDPVQEAINSFTWTILSRDAWTAQLDWRDSTGAPKSRSYRMERLGP